MLGSAQLVGFVASTDLDRSHRFYGDLLGLERIEESSFAHAYRAGPAQLRVTKVDEVLVAPYTVLGWRVDDVADLAVRLRDAGVTVNRYDGMEQDELGVWTAPGGSRIVWFLDPDGHNVSLQQPPG